MPWGIGTVVAAKSVQQGKVERNQAIEVLRIGAAFGVVAFHAGMAPTQAWYGGLIVFLALSPMFEMGVNSARKRSAADIASTFLIPLVFWFPVYGIINLLKSKPFLPENTMLGLLAGTSIHLWFLPFMFIVLLVLNQLKRDSLRNPLFIVALAGTLALVLSSPAWSQSAFLDRAPLGQWLHALPAVLLGIAIGLSRNSPARWAVVLLVMLVTISALWLQARPLFSPLAYSLGLAVLLGAMSVPRFWLQGIDVRFLSGSMMGVYLMHPLALSVFGVLLGKGTLLTVVAAFTASTIATLVLREVLPALRPVLLAQAKPA